jgi:hypothetical protein
VDLSWIRDGWSADPGTVAVLALVLWLDGWRRVDRTDLVLVRHGAGAWTVGQPWARAGALALVGWWPPIVMPLVVSTGASSSLRWTHDFDTATARGRRRLRRIAFFTATLRLLALLLLAWIAVGIPLMTGRYGSFGLVRGIVQAVVLSFAIALITALGLRTLGARWGDIARSTLALLFPFTAPRAPELLIAAALRELHPLAQAAVLLGDQRFLAWIRPWGYDELHTRARDEHNGLIPALVHELPRPLLERAVRTPPPRDASASYCPRCAQSYRDDVTVCPDCEALALVRAAHGASLPETALKG